MNPKLLQEENMNYPAQLIESCKNQRFGMVKKSRTPKSFQMNEAMMDAAPATKGTSDLIANEKQDACQVLDFSYNENTSEGNVDAILSLVNTAAHLSMEGVVVDTKNKKVLGKLPVTSEAHNKSFLELKTGFHADTPVAATDIAVLIEGVWEQNGSSHSIVVEHENAGGGLDPTYSHEWPKKENKTIEISIEDSSPAQLKTVVSNQVNTKKTYTDKIVISFNTPFYRTYDIDYLCKVTLGPHGHPCFATPGKGIISVPGASPVLSGAKGRCVVSQIDGGGAAIRDYTIDYTPRVFYQQGNELHYDMHMSWKTEYLGPPTPSAEHLYHLTIDAPFETPGGRIINVRAVVSTQHYDPSPGVVYHEIPKILFTWDCLAKDTPVALADGSFRAVQDLRNGDMLLGTDGKSVRIMDTFVVQNGGQMIELAGQEYTLSLTPDHAVYTKEGWRTAAQLKPGDLVRNTAGQWQALVSVREVEYTGSVYNLAIDADNHIFFAAGIAVGDRMANQEG